MGCFGQVKHCVSAIAHEGPLAIFTPVNMVYLCPTVLYPLVVAVRPGRFNMTTLLPLF